MKEIIKHGQKSFIIQCNRCGCEFKYDLEDISCVGYVDCPECFEKCFHPGRVAAVLEQRGERRCRNCNSKKNNKIIHDNPELLKEAQNDA